MKIYKSLMSIALSLGLMPSAYGTTARPDYVTVKTGKRVEIRVLANDVGRQLRINDINKRTVKLGTVQVNKRRETLFYRSPPGFTGSDSFWYAIKDNRGRTNSTQVFVKVIPAPRKKRNKAKARTQARAKAPTRKTNRSRSSNNHSGWPTANTDTASTSQNTEISVAVLQNDRGNGLRLTEVNDWTDKGGRASIRGNRVVYRPKAGYVGQDSFWYNFKDARGRTNSAQVKVTVNGGGNNARKKNSGNPRVVTDAIHIPMHVNFLKNQYFIWGEPTGMQSMKVTHAAPAGSAQLKVSGGLTLLNNQLISYKSTNGDYYTVATRQSRGNTIQLKTALPAPIAQWSEVWNFYHNGAHPNTIGYRSLADFALRNNKVASLNFGKHVLLGDSWFSSPGIKERLAEKLNNAQIINKGVGGDTAAQLLKRFDRDVARQKPDVVWLLAGTNDYYQGVSVATYAANMKLLIQKINAIGAKAIVFDSSVAPNNSNGTALTEKSHQYARAVKNLINR